MLVELDLSEFLFLRGNSQRRRLQGLLFVLSVKTIESMKRNTKHCNRPSFLKVTLKCILTIPHRTRG